MRYSQIFTLLVLLTVGTTNAAAVSTVVTTGEELQKAIYTATPEETIYLEAGDYIPPGDYFDVNRSVTIEAYDGPVTIDTSGKTAGFVISAPNVKIDGLNEMTIKSGVYYGIELKGELSSITIRNLVIDCAGNAYRGIYDYGANVSNLTIENVKILHPKFDGVYLYDLIVNGKYYVVRDLFVDRLSVVGAGGKGMYVASVDLAKNITIENSKFSNCSGDGVYLKDFAGKAEIVNVSTVNNDGWGMYVLGSSNYPELIFKENRIENNRYGIFLHKVNCSDIYLNDVRYNGGNGYVIDLYGNFGNVFVDGLVADYNVKSFSYGAINLGGNFEKLTVKDSYVDCAGNAYRGIYDYGVNVSNLTIENVKILYPKFDGVYLYDLIVNGKYYVVKDLFVDRLSVVGAGGKGMYVASVDLAKNITIENSKFSNCSGDGVYLKGFSGSAKIVKTIFLKNPTGLYVSGGSVNFTGNYVADNGVGVSLHLSKFAARGNIVKNNSQYGIYAYRSSISIFNSTFDENGNGDYTYSAAIYLTSGSSGEIHYCNLMPTNKYSIYNAQTNDVNAQKNYWSTTNTTVINGKIYDSNDYAYYGTVYYTPILISPALILPAPVPELFTALLLVAGLAVVFMRRLL